MEKAFRREYVNHGYQCRWDGCENEARQKGLCDKHYYRERNGIGKTVKEMSLTELFVYRGWTETPSGCWEFNAKGDKNGYGHVRGKKAHRISFEHFVGPIPDGLHVLHSCDNPPCINPAHLRVGTQADNMRDIADHRTHYFHSATHCPNGHEYPEDDGFRYADGSRCRRCRLERDSRYKERKAS